MLRKVDTQDNRQKVYECPDTGHWAQWEDADAVAYHCTLVAIRDDGQWFDENYLPITGDPRIRQFSRLKSVGIST